MACNSTILKKRCYYLPSCSLLACATQGMVLLPSVIIWCGCMPTDVSSAGYKYLASRMKKEEENPSAEQEAQDHFLLQLDKLEHLLSKYAGPYLVGWVHAPSFWLCGALPLGSVPNPPHPPSTPLSQPLLLWCSQRVQHSMQNFVLCQQRNFRINPLVPDQQCNLCYLATKWQSTTAICFRLLKCMTAVMVVQGLRYGRHCTLHSHGAFCCQHASCGGLAAEGSPPIPQHFPLVQRHGHPPCLPKGQER